MLKVGYTKGHTINLPKIDAFMIYDFIVSDERFNAPEVPQVKFFTQFSIQLTIQLTTQFSIQLTIQFST